MMNKEERQLLKQQDDDFKKQANARRQELKQLAADRKAEAKRLKKEKHHGVTAKGKEEASNNQSKKKQSQRIPKTVLDAFPIRDYDSRNDYFITDDNQIIDIFQVRGKSLYNSSDSEIENQIEILAFFNRRYKSDIKFIGMNYPTNTKNQQAFLTYMQKRPELGRYEEIINAKLENLQYLEQHTTDREAFIMIFAKNENHYTELYTLLKRSGFRVDTMSQEKKENIIFQLNNMNKMVKI
jgi:hypothetical protein